ncbi:MAG TPA: M28 family peptidase [Nitrososphaerales archaeon]|nr:M28 family peptidase [Nitrososphaerales archaeon]
MVRDAGGERGFDLANLPLVGRFFQLLSPRLVKQFRRSDHVPFWQAGIPAIMVTDGGNFSNPNYHQASDVPSTLSYRRLSEVVGALCGTVGMVAGSDDD